MKWLRRSCHSQIVWCSAGGVRVIAKLQRRGGHRLAYSLGRSALSALHTRWSLSRSALTSTATSLHPLWSCSSRMGMLSTLIVTASLVGPGGTAVTVQMGSHGGAACATDWDCALGGVCVNTTGRCQCDVWFTGANCALLNLQPAKQQNGLNYDGWSSWGGHPVFDETDNCWRGFFSLMADKCTLGAYRTNSGSVAAVAKEVDGPYTLADTTKPDAAGNWAVAPPSHCTQVKRHPSGEYHLWHILPGDGVDDPGYRNCTPDLASATLHPRKRQPPGAGFSQNLWIHAAKSPQGPWTRKFQINISDFKNGTTAQQSWCSAPYYFENGTALLIWGGQGGPTVGAGLWAGVSADWRGPYSQVQAAPIEGLKQIEDPAIFRDPRGNLHMLTNANSGHAHCQAGGACGGHSWSRDGLHWSPIVNAAFGPVVKMANGSTIDLGFVERPQIAQKNAGSAPLALFLGTGYTHRSYTWAQKFCDEAAMSEGLCGFMGGVPHPSEQH